MATGFVWHEVYGWHDTGTACIYMPTGPPAQPSLHVESPESKRRLAGLVEVSGIGDQLERITARPAERSELLRLHTPEYVDRIAAESAENGGDGGETTPFGKGGYDIACLAAGGCIEAASAVIAGKVDNAYALVRPPGHHAEADLGRGFCLFGNTALAAHHARQAEGLERVAVLDWDVHHGNGTEHAFYDDPSVLTISLHQDNLFPAESGLVDDIGEGAGKGYNINVPLPPGSGTGAYLGALDRVVAPALRAFRPELILIASGFDAAAFDPLGRMILISEDYREMTRRMLDLAAELCGGKLVVCHEGGYSAEYVPFCGLVVIEELAGWRSGVEDPFAEYAGAMGYRDLQPQQEQVIDAVATKLASGELVPTG